MVLFIAKLKNRNQSGKPMTIKLQRNKSVLLTVLLKLKSFSHLYILVFVYPTNIRRNTVTF